MSKQGRTAVFIDGANLYATAKALNFDVNYKLLREKSQQLLHPDTSLLRMYYYTAIIEDEVGKEQYSSIRPLIDYLEYNGYDVVTKPAKEFIDQNGRRKIKGNMDIELAVDAFEIAPHVERIVLFSGDGDFESLVEALQRRGVFVVVVSTTHTQPSMVADDLRRAADQFIDLDDLKASIAKDPPRPEPQQRARPAR